MYIPTSTLTRSAFQVQDEGSNLPQRDTMNFAGAGVTATDSGGKTLVTIPGGSGALPAGWYNAITDIGLVDDAVTDNTSALQTWYNALPSSGDKRAATVIFPMSNTGRYLFGSEVTMTGGKAVRFIGTGSSSAHDNHYMTGIIPGADNIIVFHVYGNGTLQQQSPSFENLSFGANSHTGVTGLKIDQSNRCHLTNVTFMDLNVGVELSENAQDCAYHCWHNVQFYSCNTGILSTSSNSWNAHGVRFTSCTNYGMDIVAGNQIQFFGGKIDTPLSGTPIGIRIAGYANLFHGFTWESGVWGGGATCVRINGDGGATSVQGFGNVIRDFVLHSAGNSNQIDTPIYLNGACNNQIDFQWQSGGSGVNPIITYAGTSTLNRINGGHLTGVATDRPAAIKIWAGMLFGATDTHVLSFSDGVAWKTVGTMT